MRRFFYEVVDEVKKITWPSKEDVKASFYVVLLGLVFLGVFVGVLDFIFSKFMAFLFTL